MYICVCNAVTEKAVRECANQGARCVEDLTSALGVAAGCGRCRECAVDLLRGLQAGDEDLALAAAR